MTEKDIRVPGAKTVALAALCALAVYLYYRILGCPIKLLTGISCAGCGMTRAYRALLRLDFRAAFHYHPLFVLPPVALGLMIFRRRLPSRIFKGCMYAIAILFLIVYVYRMCQGNNDVVEFAPQNGLVFRIFAHIKGGF